MTTVKERWGVCCPECGKDDALVCDAVIYAYFAPDGLRVDADALEDISPMDNSWTCCQSCDYSNTMDHFRTEAK